MSLSCVCSYVYYTFVKAGTHFVTLFMPHDIARQLVHCDLKLGHSDLHSLKYGPNFTLSLIIIWNMEMAISQHYIIFSWIVSTIEAVHWDPALIMSTMILTHILRSLRSKSKINLRFVLWTDEIHCTNIHDSVTLPRVAADVDIWHWNTCYITCISLYWPARHSTCISYKLEILPQNKRKKAFEY